VAGSVAAGLEQSDAGEEFGVAVDEAIAQRVVVPMRARGCEARMAVAGQGVVFALDNELGVRERVMVAGVVDAKCVQTRMSMSRGRTLSSARCSRTFFSLVEGGAGESGASGAIPESIRMCLLSAVSTR